MVENFKRYENTIDNNTEQVFFRNMHSSLKLKVQTAAKSLRKEQKKHYQRLNEFGADEETGHKFDDDNQVPEYLREKAPAQEGETGMAAQVHRDTQSEEIKNIVEGIKALTTILGQMNDIVIEQGTIVDRIDYNLEVASKHVKKGNKQLTEAKEIAENGFGSKCLKYLVIINLVLLFFVILKYSLRH